MPRPIKATIHTANLAHNLAIAQAMVSPANTFAVVKANAYGHGIGIVPAAFANADGLAIIEIENAVRLRDLGWRKPILLLEGCYDESDWQSASDHAFAVAVHCTEQLDQLASLPLRHRVDVFLKINTGMNRLGFPLAQTRAAAERATACASVKSITLMTHFACADEPDGYREQLRRFYEASAGLPFAKSLANSAACFDVAKSDGALGATGDWVRPGIMLYGATPFSHAQRPASALGLRAGMTLSTEIIGIQQLRTGDRVGYGGTFIADRDLRVAVIAAGYADGYPRHAPTGTPVLVNGQRTRLVGRVSMDKITVDVTDLPRAAIGSPVELWGEALPVDEVASAAGTIGYELLTAVAPRVQQLVSTE